MPSVAEDAVSPERAALRGPACLLDAADREALPGESGDDFGVVSGGANEGTRKTRRGGEETDAIGCRVIRHPRHRDAERSRRTRQVTCWFAGG